MSDLFRCDLCKGKWRDPSMRPVNCPHCGIKFDGQMADVNLMLFDRLDNPHVITYDKNGVLLSVDDLCEIYGRVNQAQTEGRDNVEVVIRRIGGLGGFGHSVAGELRPQIERAEHIRSLKEMVIQAAKARALAAETLEEHRRTGGEDAFTHLLQSQNLQLEYSRVCRSFDIAVGRLLQAEENAGQAVLGKSLVETILPLQHELNKAGMIPYGDGSGAVGYVAQQAYQPRTLNPGYMFHLFSCRNGRQKDAPCCSPTMNDGPSKERCVDQVAFVKDEATTDSWTCTRHNTPITYTEGQEKCEVCGYPRER